MNLWADSDRGNPLSHEQDETKSPGREDNTEICFDPGNFSALEIMWDAKQQPKSRV